VPSCEVLVVAGKPQDRGISGREASRASAGRVLADLKAARRERGVLAEDLVAETFELILRTRWRFDPRRSEKTWVYTIALSRLRDHGRRRSAESRAIERSVAAAGGNPARAWEADIDYREMLERALASLNADERECLGRRPAR
jgi:RNA polymerase sigma factor (sigma-70 family)